MNRLPDRPVRRSDLRHALQWTLASGARVAFVLALLVLAGAASLLGLLRWQGPFARGSFAAACALVAAYVSIVWWRRRRG